ncbi:MAG TPA: hypothetical protein VFZ59_04925 [Verrucomicrobiae bacterium]|nr:hypothetical protein [Verrucomicrobiae bacterium]
MAVRAPVVMGIFNPLPHHFNTLARIDALAEMEIGDTPDLEICATYDFALSRTGS